MSVFWPPRPHAMPAPPLARQVLPDSRTLPADSGPASEYEMPPPLLKITRLPRMATSPALSASATMPEPALKRT